MAIKILDNKKVEMTDDEWNMYIRVCRSYDRPSFKGEELFRDLFETDDNGIIVFLKPPSNRHTSMEVIIFMSQLMMHQQVRLFQKQANLLLEETRETIKKLVDGK